MKIVTIVSGGMDSTTLFFHLKDQGHEVFPVNFSYGGKHNARERRSFTALMESIGQPYQLVDINLSFLKSSSLLNPDIAVPHGHYAADNMKSTVVPFRNGIMLSYAVAIAEDLGYEAISLGNHAGDHTIYPDCREGFVEGFKQAAGIGTWANIALVAPFTNLRKEDIVKEAARLGRLPELMNSYSCYEGEEFHCGKCGTCQERKEAFQIAGVSDLTIYRDQG